MTKFITIEETGIPHHPYKVTIKTRPEATDCIFCRNKDNAITALNRALQEL